MSDDLDREIIGDVLAKVEKSLYESCLGREKQHSVEALKFAAQNMVNLLLLDDYDPVAGATWPATMVYDDRSKHYASDKDNTLALLAIREKCRALLLQDLMINPSALDEIFEVLNRIDDQYYDDEDTIIDL